MILVDTSVWIDFFNGINSEFRVTLHRLIDEEEDVCISDIILTEILQGIRFDKDFSRVRNYLSSFPIYSLTSTKSYIETAQIYRFCRKKGLTIRKPLDCIIARVAIENNLLLFHNDKDFDLIAKTIKELQIYPISKK